MCLRIAVRGGVCLVALAVNAWALPARAQDGGADPDGGVAPVSDAAMVEEGVSAAVPTVGAVRPALGDREPVRAALEERPAIETRVTSRPWWAGGPAGVRQAQPSPMRDGWWWQAWFAGVSGYLLGGMAGGALGCVGGLVGEAAGCIIGAVVGTVVGAGIGIAEVVDSTGDDAGGNGAFWAAWAGQAVAGLLTGLLVTGVLITALDDGVRAQEYGLLGVTFAVGLFAPPAAAVLGYQISNDR